MVFVQSQRQHLKKRMQKQMRWWYSRTEYDGTQNFKRYRYRYFFPVPNIYDTDTGTFYGTKIFRYRFRDFFPIPNFTDTSSETFFRYHFFPIPVPIPREKLIIPVTHHKYLSPKFWQWKSRFLLSSRRWPRMLFFGPDTPRATGSTFPSLCGRHSTCEAWKNHGSMSYIFP